VEQGRWGDVKGGASNHSNEEGGATEWDLDFDPESIEFGSDELTDDVEPARKKLRRDESVDYKANTP